MNVPKLKLEIQSIYKNDYHAGAKGEINLNLPITPRGNTKYLITVLWKKDGGVKKGLSQTFP